jgi:recombination protein RecT
MAKQQGKPTDGNAIVQRAKNVIALIEERKDQIKVLLPPEINYERMKWVVMNQMRRNPSLFSCTPQSIINCVMQGAQVGLEFDDIRGLAYMIPYGDQAQFIPGYKGLIELAYRSGKVRDIWAAIVYSNEQYTYREGMDRKLEHTPLSPEKRGVPVGVYAAAMTTDGLGAFAWLWIEDVEKIKKSSKASKNGPWVTHEEEMIKKTAIRRLAKTVNISPAFTKAAALDERADLGLSTRELFGEDEIDGDLPGKPMVTPPAAKDEQPEAAATPPTDVPEKDVDKHTQLSDMMNEMNLSALDTKRETANRMVKEQGVDAALKFMGETYEVWLKTRK